MAAQIFSGEDISLDQKNIISITVVFVTSAVGAIRPGLINARTVVWWHLMYMAFLCFGLVQTRFTADPTRSLFRALLAVESIAVGVMCHRLRVLAVSYACLSCCAVWSHLSSPLPGGVAQSDVVFAEVTMYLLKMLLFVHLDAMQTFAAQQEVEAKLGRCHRSAVSSLLGMVCDAVMDMDSEMRLKQHEESLSNLLMQGSGKSLRGASIMSCVVSDGGGQANFRASIDSNVRGRGGSPAPGMFGARLRDALGNNIRVTAYHVPYHTITGEVHHLLGMREDSDVKELHVPGAVLANDVAERQATPTPSLSGSSGSATSVPGGHTLTVDVALADGLPTCGASQNFRDTFGVCDGFVDVVKSDADRLVAWLREQANLVLAGAVPAPRIESFGEVVMRRVSGASRGQRRSLRVCFPPPPEAGGEYCVSIRVGRPRGPRTLGLGTSAAGEPQALGPRRSGTAVMCL